MDKVAFHNQSDLELSQVNALSAARQKPFRGTSLFSCNLRPVVWDMRPGHKD
jgi:hypothetical protein